MKQSEPRYSGSTKLRQCWRNYRIEVIDSTGQCLRKDIQVLIRADYANQLLQEKIEIEGEVAWKTNFGRVPSGKAHSLRNASVFTQHQDWSMSTLFRIKSKLCGKLNRL